MAINTQISGCRFQFSIKSLEQGVFHLHLIPAQAAYHMMMLLTCDFIPEMTIACVCRASQTVCRKKLKGAVHGGFGEPGKLSFCKLIDFTRGKVCTGVAKNVKDRQTLGREAMTASAELQGIFSSAGHRKSYCKFLQ
jgi:hypothetical protein